MNEFHLRRMQIVSKIDVDPSRATLINKIKHDDLQVGNFVPIKKDVNNDGDLTKPYHYYRIKPSILWGFCVNQRPSNSPFDKDFVRLTNDAIIKREDEIDKFLTLNKQYSMTLDAKRKFASGRTLEYLESEWDKAKFSWMKGKYPGWQYDIATTGDVNISDDADYIFTNWATLFAKSSKMGPRSLGEFIGPMTTNSGEPAFTKGYYAKFLCGLLAEPTFKKTIELAETFHKMNGLDPNLSLAYGVSSRLMPTRKAIPLIDEYFVQYGETTCTCRVRQVWMAAEALVLLLEPLMMWMKRGRLNLNYFINIVTWHDNITHTRVYNRAVKRKFRYKSDLSGYDRSVSRSVQLHLVAAKLAKFNQRIYDWYHSEQLPLILPSEDRSYATLMSKAGQTSTGLLLTSDIGTYVNTGLVLLGIYKACKCVNWQQLIGIINEHMDIFILGDDTFICSDIEINAELYNKANAEIGFTSELGPGNSFLSKHMSNDGWHAIESRVRQNSICPEYPEADPIISIIGLAARLDNPVPEQMMKDVGDYLKMFDFYNEYKIYSRDDAKAWLKRHETDVIKTLASRDGLAYINRLMRRAEVDPSAAEIVNWFNREYPNQVKSTPVDAILYRKLKKFSLKRPDEKLKLADKMWNLLLNRTMTEDDEMHFLQSL